MSLFNDNPVNIIVNTRIFRSIRWQPLHTKSRYVRNPFYMQKKYKALTIIVTTVILVTSVTIYVLWNKPHKNVKDATPVELTAVDLYTVFITDSLKAKSLYVDKVIQVSGEIARLSLNQQAQQIILIKTAVDGGYINCTMEKRNDALKAGDKITLKGICSGYISGDIDMGLPGDVFLVRCYPINR